MGSGIFFPVCALFVSILILTMLCYRKHINTIETRLYSWLVSTNFLGLIIELCCTLAAYFSCSFILDSTFLIYITSSDIYYIIFET